MGANNNLQFRVCHRVRLPHYPDPDPNAEQGPQLSRSIVGAPLGKAVLQLL
jgi:hypothetical protein